MHQGENQQGIIEYHLCSQCQEAVMVPTDPDFRSFELCCKLKRSEVNSEGGLTDCIVFHENGVE